MNDVQTPSGQSPAAASVSVLPSQDARPDKIQWITSLSSLTVILAATAYLIGFVVVNSALFKYGMVPFDFLQPRYISAGLLYLAATAGYTSAIFLLIHLTKTKHLFADITNSEIKSAWVIFFVFAMSSEYLIWLFPKSDTVEWWLADLRFPSLALAFITSSLNTTILPLPERLNKFAFWWRKHMWESGWLSWLVLSLMLVNSAARLGNAFFFYPIFLVGIWFFSSGFRPNQKAEYATSENTHGLFWGITNLGLSIYTYGALTYPLISPHVGGGKPLLVSVSLKPDSRRIIGRIMGREDWKCVMHNISLIHENSELIYILPKGYIADETAIAIPKTEIISMAYQRKQKDQYATCFE